MFVWGGMSPVNNSEAMLSYHEVLMWKMATEDGIAIPDGDFFKLDFVAVETNKAFPLLQHKVQKNLSTRQYI